MVKRGTRRPTYRPKVDPPPGWLVALRRRPLLVIGVLLVMPRLFLMPTFGRGASGPRVELIYSWDFEMLIAALCYAGVALVGLSFLVHRIKMGR
jgi:hypothetical protein